MEGRDSKGRFLPGVSGSPERVWKKGQSGNPKGPLPGTKAMFSRMYMQDFVNRWEIDGEQVMETVAKENPALFFSVAQKVIPNELKIEVEKVSASDYSMQELANMLNGKLLEGEVVDDPDAVDACPTGVKTVLASPGGSRNKTVSNSLDAANVAQPSKPLEMGASDPRPSSKHDQSVGQDNQDADKQ